MDNALLMRIGRRHPVQSSGTGLDVTIDGFGTFNMAVPPVGSTSGNIDDVPATMLSVKVDNVPVTIRDVSGTFIKSGSSGTWGNFLLNGTLDTPLPLGSRTVTEFSGSLSMQSFAITGNVNSSTLNAIVS